MRNTRQSGSTSADGLVSRRLNFLVLLAALLAGYGLAQDTEREPLRSIDIGGGIQLHYLDQGRGTPVVFVHGSLSDGGYWADQIGPFAQHHRVIVYSRRYNYPNANPDRRGYSAVVDAQDLAGLIRGLKLGHVVIIGHSYGALTGLFLAVKHPEMLRAMVLAEPPAISLLAHIEGPERDAGKTAFDDIQLHMVDPMKRAFKRGDREAGIAAFLAYCFNDPRKWEELPEQSRQETLRNAHEWDVVMTAGRLFPSIEPSQVRAIRTPALLLSGGRSYSFLGIITRELARLLPKCEAITFEDAGHQMWYQHPDECRDRVEAFLLRVGVH